MIKLIQIATALVLFVQTMAYGQTENVDTISNQQSSVTANETEKFIGAYFLAEADITLEIIQEEGKFYLLAPGSKDVLVHTNETTLREEQRGVDLEIIKDNENALLYTQNGYMTTIKRVTSKN